jgi:beta-alanine--pyruvate transaminase
MTTSLTLDHFWMPFTANRQFKAAPRMISRASGNFYYTPEGREILDGSAGLWCVNAGHCREPIVRAVQEQIASLDFAPTFQMGHPLAFEAAEAVCRITPAGMKRVFFTNSGSESADTSLKIALAYHRARGDGARRILIGRERGYHGTNFGGIAVGGIPMNRKLYGGLLAGVDHMRSTHDLARNAFTRGQPDHGADFLDELETRILPLHDPSNVAAIIVEPLAGSTGVLVPPKGYLQRLRSICDKHGILLIFDEVITGFGRLGTPFAADFFGVIPDMINVAKAMNNAAIPMGAVIARNEIHDTIVQASAEGAIEFFHGYTYSGHPMGCAATIATQKLFADEGLFQRAAGLSPYLEDAVHQLRGTRHVIDVRNLGFVAGIELEPRAGAPGRRAYEALVRCFDAGSLIRVTGDIIALSPPLTFEKAHVDRLVDTIRKALEAIE